MLIFEGEFILQFLLIHISICDLGRDRTPRNQTAPSGRLPKVRIAEELNENLEKAVEESEVH